jgi:hypothetical protein
MLAAGIVAAQTTDPAAPRAVPNGRLPEAKRTDKPTKYGKTVLPDPDLLDGSSYEKEKRPLHGMLSEIEMGENEGGRQGKISPNSGPAGGGAQAPSPDKPNAGGMAAAQPKEQPDQPAGGGAEAEKIPEGQTAAAPGGSAAGKPTAGGPAAAAEGIQVANLQVPEGAGSGGSGDTAKPREQQIGDATLQIQTIKQNAPNVVGAQQPSTGQQFEKKVPSGASSIPSQGNTGVEKGRVVPKGL